MTYEEKPEKAEVNLTTKGMQASFGMSYRCPTPDPFKTVKPVNFDITVIMSGLHVSFTACALTIRGGFKKFVENA